MRELVNQFEDEYLGGQHEPDSACDAVFVGHQFEGEYGALISYIARRIVPERLPREEHGALCRALRRRHAENIRTLAQHGYRFTYYDEPPVPDWKKGIESHDAARYDPIEDFRVKYINGEIEQPAPEFTDRIASMNWWVSAGPDPGPNEFIERMYRVKGQYCRWSGEPFEQRSEEHRRLFGMLIWNYNRRREQRAAIAA